MSYSYDKFLRPITESDKSIKILDNTNDIKYTIDPFVITNVAAINNILRISLRSLKVILLNFSTKNEAKIALTRLQQQIDTLTTKVPILIDKDIKNYIQNQIDKIGIIVGPTGPQGATGSADRYAATSSTTFETPVVGEVIDLVTQTDLAYSTAQNVVIYSDLPNLYNSDYETDGSYFIGQIDYYDTQTGDMSLVTTFSSGSGTYSFWYLNLSGMTSDNSSLDLTSLTTDIIPAVDSQYSLGTSASQRKSLHVSGQTIYIGGLPLSTDGESLVVNSINLGTTASPLILSANNDVLLLNGTGSIGATGATGPQGIQGATGPADNSIKRYAYWAPYITTDPSGMGATYIATNATNTGENGIELTNTNTGGQNGLINWSSSNIDWTKDFRMSAVVYLSTYPAGTVGDGFVLYAGATAAVNTVYANSADNGLKFRLFTYDGVGAPHQSGASFWLNTTKSSQGKTGNSSFLGIWGRYTVEVCNDRVSNKRMAYAYFQNDVNYGGKWPLAAMDVTSWVPTGNNFGFYCSTGAARSSQSISTIIFEAL
jgi:hypothetical protein